MNSDRENELVRRRSQQMDYGQKEVSLDDDKNRWSSKRCTVSIFYTYLGSDDSQKKALQQGYFGIFEGACSPIRYCF